LAPMFDVVAILTPKFSQLCWEAATCPKKGGKIASFW